MINYTTQNTYLIIKTTRANQCPKNCIVVKKKDNLHLPLFRVKLSSCHKYKTSIDIPDPKIFINYLNHTYNNLILFLKVNYK